MIKNIKEATELLKGYDLTEALKNDEPHDIISELADSNVDVYNWERLEWLTGDIARATSVNEAVDELGYPDNIFKAIGYGQYKDNEAMLFEAWEELKSSTQ